MTSKFEISMKRVESRIESERRKQNDILERIYYLDENQKRIQESLQQIEQRKRKLDLAIEQKRISNDTLRCIKQLFTMKKKTKTILYRRLKKGPKPKPCLEGVRQRRQRIEKEKRK